MNVIDSYKNLKNATYIKNTLSVTNDKNNIENCKKDQDDKINNNADSIEINKNQNIINTKKAHDAFIKTCDEIGPTSWNGYTQTDMQIYFSIFRSEMESRGISVPDFCLDGQNSQNTNFISFIDKMKDFTNSLLQNHEINSVPTNFFEFCDKYKENLTTVGCK